MKWISQNHYIRGGRLLRMDRGMVGCLFCMNVCQTSIISVGKFLMMIKIAFYGLVVKER